MARRNLKNNGDIALTGNLNANSNKVTNLAAPTAGSSDAATATYAENIAAKKVRTASAAPGSPSAADVYYDTDDNKLYFYNGTTWLEVATV